MKQAKEAKPLAVSGRTPEFVEIHGVVWADTFGHLLEFWSGISTACGTDGKSVPFVMNSARLPVMNSFLCSILFTTYFIPVI